jgi:hypothetical protein
MPFLARVYFLVHDFQVAAAYLPPGLFDVRAGSGSPDQHPVCSSQGRRGRGLSAAAVVRHAHGIARLLLHLVFASLSLISHYFTISHLSSLGRSARWWALWLSLQPSCRDTPFTSQVRLAVSMQMTVWPRGQMAVHSLYAKDAIPLTQSTVVMLWCVFHSRKPSYWQQDCFMFAGSHGIHVWNGHHGSTRGWRRRHAMVSFSG